MSDETHYGDILINYEILFELLHQALQLPDTYHVWGCSDEYGDDYFAIFVESAEIPHVADGEPRPLVTPHYECKDEKTITRTSITIEPGWKHPTTGNTQASQEEHMREIARQEIRKSLTRMTNTIRQRGGPVR